ncbi:hypothetical protein GCM10023074_31480 [Microbispora amethystogenes]|uniref:Uncharacterized protein n=1 Tax=Microbispora amethystogenes TaxID=1427754 RepID=A0ABQ4FF30_9ACTN|nr:hypothetical protein Mam01_35910 [Microbispora amethystogenes]
MSFSTTSGAATPSPSAANAPLTCPLAAAAAAISAPTPDLIATEVQYADAPCGIGRFQDHRRARLIRAYSSRASTHSPPAQPHKAAHTMSMI